MARWWFEWNECLCQLIEARRPWFLLETARDHSNRLVRAAHYDLLREALGPARFAAGRIPPAVPERLQSLFKRPDLAATGR